MGSPPRILVGRFGAPHGVRGEVRLQSFTQDPKAIGSYGPLSSEDGRRFSLTGLRIIKGSMLVVQVAGIADRSEAERLTRVELFVDRSALPPPAEEEFYITDLVGLSAVDSDGRAMGTIVDVPNYGGGDLIEVRASGASDTRLFPFTREVVPMIDMAARRATIVPPVEVEGDDG